MALEFKSDQPPELPCLDRSHNLPADILKADSIGCSPCLGVAVQVLPILRNGEVEQRPSVIKHRGCSEQHTAVVVPQDSEVVKVPVLVVNHRIEHQYTFDFLIGFRSQIFIILQACFQSALPDNTANGNVRCVDVCEQLTAEGEDALPVLQFVAHRMQAHGLGDLAGLKLAVGFVSRVGRVEGAAFVQVDAVPLDKPPSFGQHPVGGQLRRGGEGGVALTDSRIGHRGQNFREPIFI